MGSEGGLKWMMQMKRDNREKLMDVCDSIEAKFGFFFFFYFILWLERGVFVWLDHVSCRGL